MTLNDVTLVSKVISISLNIIIGCCKYGNFPDGFIFAKLRRCGVSQKLKPFVKW